MAVLHSIKDICLAAATRGGSGISKLSTLLFLLICVHSVFAAAQTVAVLPINAFEVFPRDVIIRRLGGVENYLKECREASCIIV